MGLTGKEIAEVIWLALQEDSNESSVVDVVGVYVEQSTMTQRENTLPLPPLDLEDAPQSDRQAQIVPPPVERVPSLALPPNYKYVPVPDAPAISQALDLARALRPLASQVAVGLANTIDEEATVDFIAETRVWQPVLKPATELWLDVALIFDTSPSMCLWQRFGADLHQLLARYGEFRDVRIWLLQHAGGSTRLTDRNHVVRRPSELLTGDRRRLIVIVSDCVAPAWHNGNMQNLISTWSAKLPTVVFHVFPERLWSRTALARSVTVELQAKDSGAPSNELRPLARSVWDQDRLERNLSQAKVRLPVVSVEPDAMLSWAQLVAGDRRSRTLGVVWDARSATVKHSEQSVSVKDRIDAFMLTASPISREMAGLFASAPVITLPIARLIKQSMLPQSSSVHMAEIFMSGLLKVSGEQVPTFENAERIPYGLVNEEVRDRLRAGLLVGDALDVFQKVSSYVAKGLGKSVSEFWALLRTPSVSESSEETEFLDAFAAVSAKILRGLGSEFEAIANSLAPPVVEPSDSAEETDDFPLEDIEYEVAQFVNFPPLQTCEYQSATITAILDRFDFETVTLVRGIEPSTPTEDSWNAVEGDYPPVVESELPPAVEFELPPAVEFELPPDVEGDYPPPIEPDDPPAVEGDYFSPSELDNEPTEDEPGWEQEARWLVERKQSSAWGYTEILSSDTGEEIGLDMIAIPEGRFIMGASASEPESQDRERPQHEVTLQSFYMGRYAITQAQWRVVAGYEQIDRELDPDPSRFKGDNRPVESVSWQDAQEFCKRLSRETGKDYRLPSEAQWEYACRAGTTTPFHFGEIITTELANYDGNRTYNGSPKGEFRGETTDVGSFPGNAWGLHDMHGNVDEWCEDDWHDSYEGAPQDGSAWVEADRTETRQILRGGSWYFNPESCRSAVRVSNTRGSRNNYFGFRVCCVPPRILP